MNIPSPYFKDIPTCGDLFMDQILVEYGVPLLSVLRDSAGLHYLCLCCDTRGSQRWIIAPISATDLLRLLENRLQLRNPFETGGEKILVTRNYDTGEETASAVSTAHLDDLDLPAPNEFLDADEGDFTELRYRLAGELADECWDTILPPLNLEVEFVVMQREVRLTVRNKKRHAFRTVEGVRKDLCYA